MWFLIIWGVRVHRLSHPSAIAPTATVQALQKHPTAHPRSSYSWHTPFLRRPSSTSGALAAVSAK
ncbi:MAG: hypothetical protein ACXWPP_07915 [Ktedonobacteraceae bacterium]